MVSHGRNNVQGSSDLTSIWKKKTMTTSTSKIVRYFSNTEFVQNYVFYMTMVIVSSIIKLYFVTTLCSAFSFSPLIDFFIQILISVIVHFIWCDSCVKFLSENSKLLHLDKMIKRIVSDLSEDKIDRIKRALFIERV